jgi:hypothetical protein
MITLSAPTAFFVRIICAAREERLRSPVRWLSDGEHTFALRDRTVIMLFDQMWRRRINSLAMQAAD